jgi:hypothetical protein
MEDFFHKNQIFLHFQTFLRKRTKKWINLRKSLATAIYPLRCVCWIKFLLISHTWHSIKQPKNTNFYITYQWIMHTFYQMIFLSGVVASLNRKTVNLSKKRCIKKCYRKREGESGETWNGSHERMAQMTKKCHTLLFREKK